MGDATALKQVEDSERYGGESDARQVFHRLAGCWTDWGLQEQLRSVRHVRLGRRRDGRSTTRCVTMLAAANLRAEFPAMVQHGAALRIRNRRVPHKDTRYVRSEERGTRCVHCEERPTSARNRTLASSSRSAMTSSTKAGSWICGQREARLFKYGSGTGSNFSHIRGEGRAPFRRRPFLGADELPEDRRLGRPARSRAAAQHATRCQDGGASTSITRTSRTSSPGRSKRSRRLPRWSTGSRCDESKLNEVLEGAATGAKATGDRDSVTEPVKKNPALEAGVAGRPRLSAVSGHGYIQRDPVRPIRAYTRSLSSSRNSTRTGKVGGVPTVSGQNSNNSGPGHRTNSWSRSERRVATGISERRITDGDSHQDPAGPRPVGHEISLFRLEPAPIPGLQYRHARSTSGTPVPEIGRINAPPIRARSTCSSTTRPATWRPSTCMRFFDADSVHRSDRPGKRLSTACSLWTMVLGDLGHDGPVPVEGHRPSCPTNTAPSVSDMPTSGALLMTIRASPYDSDPQAIAPLAGAITALR